MPYSPKQKIVVGVSGVSCGGKTTVASGLNNWLNKSEQNATLIMQDDFYKPASELPINSITNFPEFDEPESVRMDLIKDKILEWLEEPVELDQEDAQILIVEGTEKFKRIEEFVSIFENVMIFSKFLYDDFHRS